MKPLFFSVIRDGSVKPIAHTSEDGSRQLSGNIARLISAVSLGAALLGTLSGCGSTSDIPCPTPTATNDSSSSKPISCTNNSGGHYLWYPSRGGWVPSDDGVHPRPGASGVGGDDGHGGVGGDHGGSGGEGGGEGGGAHGGGGEGG
ncbi:hypothetical protein KDH_34280 [Dictyobacter sp. S3.2.2.5]|uniref:Lipoprotein n=1 Tax=Dictyobacter halimunensis TaxID=3026934 RepID=A0ABQ6FQP8_9CHLR|nr:hypothetical protein KDH_34280 [Dictyobacter sp. S3.2.2.5]